MKTHTVIGSLNKVESYFTLSELVDQLATSLLPQTVEKKSVIVNEVQQEMPVHADKDILATVLSNLLIITVAHTENNCIRVRAKFYGNIILVHVKNDDSSHDGAIAQSLKQIQPLAEKLGGCIAI